jgi:uncharacterized membrane protein YhaH (DUF805 family)
MRQMSVGQWYVSRGRIDRRTFWLYYFLPLLAASVVAELLDVALGFTEYGSTADSSLTGGPIAALVTLATLVPSISSTVTRLHDRDHSAWWLLWGLLPVIGWLVLIVQTWFLPGTAAPNRYGPPTRSAHPPVPAPGYPQPYA